MTAGQDGARAREIARKYSRGLLLGNELADAIQAALREARDQGARDRDAQIIEACRQKGNGGVPFITELTAKLPLPSAALDIFAESAKNTPAFAPNPHLDELTTLSQEMGLHDTPGTVALREAEPARLIDQHADQMAAWQASRGAPEMQLERAVVTAAMDWYRTICAPMRERVTASRVLQSACAALSSAQGSTTEGRDV